MKNKLKYRRTNFENFRWSTNEFGYLTKDVFKRVSGVYFLMNGSDIVYVGKSVNILSRCIQHRIEKSKSFDGVSYLKISPEILDVAEAYFILEFKPKYNSLQHFKYRTIDPTIAQFLESLLRKTDNLLPGNKYQQQTLFN